MIQVEQLEEIEPIAPGAKLVHFNDLKHGDKFQYMGGDPEEWNTVTAVTEDEITYQVGRSHTPATNDRLFKTLHVWLKGEEV